MELLHSAATAVSVSTDSVFIPFLYNNNSHPLYGLRSFPPFRLSKQQRPIIFRGPRASDISLLAGKALDLVKKMVSVSGGIVDVVKLVAVAVDKGSRSSREALKWAIDHVVAKGQSIMLVYVDRSSPTSLPLPYEKNELEIRREPDEKVMDVLTPYICFCLLRQVECEPIVLQHINVAEALRRFILLYGVQTLVLGGVTRHRFVRIFRVDVQTMLEKDIPIFCKVYRICNGRIKNSKAVSCAGRPACCRVAAEETISPERAAPELEWSAPISVPVSPSVSTPVSAPMSAPLSRISSTNRPDVLSFRDGDISVNHSERPSTDSTFISFYNSLGNRGLSSESMKKNTVKYYGIHSPNESTTSCHLHDPASTKDIEI